MKKLYASMKRILALLIVFGLVTGMMPAAALEGIGAVIVRAAEASDSLEINNGFIKVTVSKKTGGFGIRTVDGDKINKSDNDQYLVFEYDEDNTSFTSFQVTRDGETREYIFGGKYPGSSAVSVSKAGDDLVATWSVDDLTFTQTVTLVKTGANEHGTAVISYEVANSGAPAQVKCRILMDTALGYQDYAYYRIGKEYLERETMLSQDGYEKSFYAVTNTGDPRIVAYTINASIDDRECKPYQTIFAHWNNLASTVFDYAPDDTMTFTNFNNKKYLTSDSAYALYFDMGQVNQGASASAATNYGVYSNESMDEQDTVAVNVNAPDVIQYATKADGSEDRSAYENGGKFTVKTHVKNISDKTYTDIRIVVTTAGCIEALDQLGNSVGATIDSPYSMKITDVEAGEQLDIEWNFLAEPQQSGQYSRIAYKVYDVSDDATLGSGQIMQENLLGEGYSYIMCPGSVTKAPLLKFTGSSPETIYSSGVRSFNVTGENFSMLLDKSAYALTVSRVDGKSVDGKASFVIPADQFQIDDSANVISVILNDENPGTLPEGRYQLTIDYTDTSKQDVSGKALQFEVSDDEKYKNDSYGFLAVVKNTDGGTFAYTIEHFLDEETYWGSLDSGYMSRENVLLEFQGNFIKQKTDDGTAVYKGVSNNKSHNVMTLNGCLDIRNGTCTITEDDGSVTVDFDADIYTTGSNTYVHTGVAALTELEKGEDYSLIPYSEDGERGGVSGEIITLLWPSVGQAFQNIMGMLFNLRYGELGVIDHDGAPGAQGSQTRVVGFGAAMDLSFLIPSSTDKQIILGRTAKTKDALGSSYDAAEHNKIQFSAAELRALNKQADCRLATANTNATMEDVDMGRFSDMTVDDTPGYNAFSIGIDDILFGGEYLGLNLELALGIPPYIMNMPALECVLSIHTVGDWSFGVEGQCHFTSFKLQASLYIMSKDGVPIVDSMHFFLGGFTPGINIDGVGVLWLQGAGGGIENIYDTIFMTDKIPPLKLILQAQFSVMQIFSAIATMGLSMRGIELTLTNGQFTEHTDESSGVITVPQPITMNAGVQLDWYPEFYFLGYVNMMLAMVINGGGYVVADAQGFYEFFLRAGVSVPTDVPFIGGYEVADMNLGVNTSKVWGKMSLLDIVSIALTYYWGGDIDWNNGAGVYPTYPELLGMDAEADGISIPVDYNETTGQILYMKLGSNVTFSTSTTSDLIKYRKSPIISDELTTDVINGSLHTMKLVKNGSGKILAIQWNSESEEKARTEAASISIASSVNSANQIPVKLWNKDSGEDANAIFSYDPETKTAYVSVVFGANDDTVYGTKWNINTPAASQLVVFDVAPMPEVEGSAQTDGEKITLNLTETQEGVFTNVTVVAEGKNSGQTYLLGGARNPFTAGKATLNLTLPEQAISDTYTLRIVCKDDNAQYYHEENVEITYTNPNQPAAPTAVSAENAGDYKVAVTASAPGEFDGYSFTVYDAQGNVPAGMSGVLLNKDGSIVYYDENGRMMEPDSTDTADSYIIGGHFEQTVKNEDGEDELLVTGLSVGEYTVEVRTWKKVAGGFAALVSEPVTTKVTVRKPVATTVTVSAASVNGYTALTEDAALSGGGSYKLTTVADSSVLLQLTSAAESFSGKWRVDGGFREDLRGEITSATTAAKITLSNLEEGQHMFTFQGVNQYGDAVTVNFQFAVDTLGPRMLLDAPVNGSLFDYWTGELEISGITDRDVTITVVDNTKGETVLDKTQLQVDENGRFSQMIALECSTLCHDLTITLADKLGNESSRDVSVMSNGLGSIEKLMIYYGNTDVTNTKLTAGGTYALRLMAKLKAPAGAAVTLSDGADLVVLINTDGMVDWVQEVPEGTSELQITKDGILLATTSDAEGMITARFLVSDEGSLDVSAAFGYTGKQILDLDSDFTQFVTTDQLYTGTGRTTDLQVWYRGTLLVEGADYVIEQYTNNVEVTTEESKAQVHIKGMGAYTGTAIAEFDISYLELDESWVTLSGVKGNNGYYISDVDLLAAEGYELVEDGEGKSIVMSDDGENSKTFRVRRLSDGAMTDLVTRSASIDKTAPTGTIKLDKSGWNSFVENITFGLITNEDMEATITAEDACSGMESIEYVVSSKSLTRSELDSQSWTEYTGPVTINKEGNYVVYAKLTDKAGNVSYIGTDGLVIDTTAPHAVGIEDGGVYYGDTTFTVYDDVASVTVDGKTVTLVDGAYTIEADNGEHTVIVTDKAGNRTEYTITVYKNYTVIYKADGKVISTQTVGHGKNAEAPLVPAKSGYTGKWDHDGKNITADLTITAVYKVIPNEDVPETGDNNQIMLWSSLSLISLLVIVCLLLFGKKLLYKGKSDK